MKKTTKGAKSVAKTIATERLTEIRHAVATDGEIDWEMRADIAAVLWELERARKVDAVTGGRDMAVPTFMAAALSRALIDRHQVHPKDAAHEAAIASFRKLIMPKAHLSTEAVAARYRKIKRTAMSSETTGKGQTLTLLDISEGLIAHAFEQLHKDARRSAPPKRKPAPPYEITVHLQAKPEKSKNK